MSTSDIAVAKIRFCGTRKDQILVGLDKLFWSARGSVGLMSPGGALDWQRCIGEMHSFLYSKDRTKLEIMPVPAIIVKDLFFSLKKKMGLTVDLTIARKGLSVVLEEEDAEAPLAPRKKAKTSYPVVLKQMGKIVAPERPDKRSGNHLAREGWF